MVSGLEAHLGYWLRLVSNQVSQSFAARLEQEDVSVAEWVLLRLLHDQDRRPSEIAASMDLTRGAVTKIVDRLGLRGLLVREAGEAEDGRVQTVALTKKGRALVPRLAALADANDAAFFGDLSRQDRAALQRILAGLARRHGLQRSPTQ